MSGDLGKCIIVSAPSGAGKTTIVRHLLEHETTLAFSVSAISRAKRSYEVDGKDYHFISAEEFQRLLSGELIHFTSFCSGPRHETPRARGQGVPDTRAVMTEAPGACAPGRASRISGVL